MLSMPKDTDRLGVHNAVRDFAREEFGGKYAYVFASHDDTDHPHAHLIVKTQGRGGKRLNPRKADLQRWRRTFAEKLREHGIEANATTRRTRGITKYPRKRAAIEAEKDGRSLTYRGGKSPEPYRDLNDAPSSPYAAKTAQTHGEVLRAYKGIAEALQHSPDASDRRLAVELVGFVQAMPYEREQAQAQAKTKVKTPKAQEQAKQPGKDRGG
jgi:type IV secretory pathway VirD2 relaxase